jgi:hypothetical protein
MEESLSGASISKLMETFQVFRLRAETWFLMWEPPVETCTAMKTIANTQQLKGA